MNVHQASTRSARLLIIRNMLKHTGIQAM